MKRIIAVIGMATMLAAGAASANQFEVLRNIETQTEQAEKAKQAELDRQLAAERAAAKREADAAAAREFELRKKQIAADAAVRAKKAEADKIRAAAAARAQAKVADFQDANRNLDLEERRLRLEAMRTRVKRENDVIDAELNREKAKTDAIQSTADARRNVSGGVKSYLQDQGKAEVNRSNKIFGGK